MTTDLSVPCLRCGRPANPEHHQPPDRNSIGMGGTSDPDVETWRTALCRTCHDSLHRKEWRLEVVDGIASGFKGDMQIFERGTVTNDLGDDPRYWSDERLCYEWWAAEESAFSQFQRQCAVAYWFFRRYKWAEKWYEQAAAMLSEYKGKAVHWRRVYERIKVYLAFDGHWDDYDYLGATLALAVAESDEPPTALEIALTAKDDGKNIGQAVALVKGREMPDGEWETCPTCNGLGRVKKEPEANP